MSKAPTDVLSFGPEFLERFEVVRRVGQGAFGVVLEVRQRSLDRSVAVKYLLGKQRDSQDARARFLREARILSTLSHPNVVQVFDSGFDGDVPYLVEELLAGKPLDTVMLEQGQLPTLEVVRIGRSVAQALGCAHELGVLHRDLKPANVFVGDDGTVKLLDFGLAKRPGEDTTLTKTGQLAGTPAFMSPEQLKGEDLTPAADLYALGTMLYLMLTGAYPYPLKLATLLTEKLKKPAPKVQSVATAPVPEALASLVDSLLELDPSARPQSGREVADALARFDPDASRPVRATESLAAPPRLRNPARPSSSGAGQPPVSRPSGPVGAGRGRWQLVVAALVLAAAVAAFVAGRREPSALWAVSVRPGIDRLTVSWSTSRPVATVLRWAPVGGEEVEVRGEGPPQPIHEVTVTGLAPGRRYLVRPVVDGVVAEGREAATLGDLAVTELKVVPTATSLRLSTAATLPGTATVSVRAVGTNEELMRRTLEGRGPAWEAVLQPLPAKTVYRVTVEVAAGADHRATLSETAETKQVAIRILLGGIAGTSENTEGVDFTSLWTTKNSPRSVERVRAGLLAFSLEKLGVFGGDVAAATIRWRRADLTGVQWMRLSGDRVVILDEGRRMTCLRLDDGGTLWARDLPAATDVVFHATDDAIVVYEVPLGPRCIDPATGAQRWWLDNSVLKPPWTVTEDGTVWFHSDLYDMWAFSVASGRRIPDYRAQVIARVTAPPVLVGGEMFVGLKDGKVQGGPKAGQRRVLLELGGPIQDLVAGGGGLYAVVEDPPALVGIDVPAGKVLWRTSLPSPVRGRLVYTRGRVYAYDDADHTGAWDAATGRLLWRRYANNYDVFGMAPAPGGILYCSGLTDVAFIVDDEP